MFIRVHLWLFLVFDKLLGNEQIKAVLRRMLAVNRVPGSLIFAGNAGVGKRQFAFELAKSMLCLTPKDFESCGKCSACLRVDNLELPKTFDRDDNERVFFTQHPDVGFIRQAGRFITVNTVRGLQAEAVLRPFEGANGKPGARFFIVDDADKMNEEAANALLKTLEEPAPTTHLILLTARPNSLLQTIKSRCQMLRFAPVALREIEQFLLDTKKFSPNDTKIAARVADGSLGKALSLNVDKYREQREQMLSVLDALAVSKDRARLLKIAEDMNDAKLKDELETRLEILQTLVHDVWALELGAGEKSIVNHDLAVKLAKIAAQTESAALQNWLRAIETLREQFAVNVNRKIAVDAMFIGMANA